MCQKKQIIYSETLVVCVVDNIVPLAASKKEKAVPYYVLKPVFEDKVSYIHLVLKHRLEHIVQHRLFSLRCRKRYYVVNHAYAKGFTIYNLFLLKHAFTSVFTYTSIISQTAFFFKNILSGIYFFIFLVIEIWSDACILILYLPTTVHLRCDIHL